MTTQEMMKTRSSLGGWKNIANLGDPPNWIEDYPPETIDPNKETIFGYDMKEFISWQYKQTI